MSEAKFVLRRKQHKLEKLREEIEILKFFISRQHRINAAKGSLVRDKKKYKPKLKAALNGVRYINVGG